jgi:hypothetical protein
MSGLLTPESESSRNKFREKLVVLLIHCKITKLLYIDINNEIHKPPLATFICKFPKTLEFHKIQMGITTLYLL